ncbi:RlpA-like protein precursor [bacterium BMS3Abin07]|nr:RlpA-like protein precursor [bacterium BMS3Abin07]GBE31542.1 RlpA-like protein precursor [bacterium BMS3Bbin05]
MRKSFVFFLLAVPVMLFMSCSSSTYETRGISSRTYYWTASYYGKKFHGRSTASGRIFNMYGKSAAHKSLPFGTMLEVTNISNGRKVIVTVNDRGPFVKGRQLDLSYGAARQIGMIQTGTTRVKARIIGRERGYVKRVSYSASQGPYTLQVGSFRDRENALSLKNVLRHTYGGVYISNVTINGISYFRVCMGKFRFRRLAEKTAERLADEGYGVMVIAYDERI